MLIASLKVLFCTKFARVEHRDAFIPSYSLKIRQKDTAGEFAVLASSASVVAPGGGILSVVHAQLLRARYRPNVVW